MGWVLGGIDRTRHGYTAGVVRRLVQFSVVSLLIIGSFTVGIYFAALPHADRLFARRGSRPSSSWFNYRDFGASVSRTSGAVKGLEDML